jgi:hypothetical protein
MKNRYSYLGSMVLVFLILSAVLMPSALAEEEEYCRPLYYGEINVDLLDYQPCSDCGLFYMKIDLSGIPEKDPPFLVEDGIKLAYYMQEDQNIDINGLYEGYLICTYNETDLRLNQAIEWDKINYILNHKQGDWEDIQDAIWIYTGDITKSQASTLGKAMYDEAEAEGKDFRPGPLEMLGIYIYLPNQDTTTLGLNYDVQDLLIEVQLPFDYHVPELPLGTLTALATMMAALFIKYRKEL